MLRCVMAKGFFLRGPYLGCMYARILLPTDGSQAARAAMDHALRLAKVEDAEIHALFVVDTAYPYTGFEAPNVLMDEVIDSLEELGGEATRAIAERAEAEGIACVRAVKKGSRVSQAIVDYASEHDIDMIVMGTHGRTGWRRYLIGSVTEEVLRTCQVPVLTIRAGDG